MLADNFVKLLSLSILVFFFFSFSHPINFFPSTPDLIDIIMLY